MVDDALTQSDANTLLRMEKVPASAGTFQLPDLGGRIEVALAQGALRSYDITPIAWSQREEFRERLAA